MSERELRNLVLLSVVFLLVALGLAAFAVFAVSDHGPIAYIEDTTNHGQS